MPPRRIWAVVPAAGRGERFVHASGGDTPKQYRRLAGGTVLEWSLRALIAEPRIQGVVVVLAANDRHWPGLAARLNSPKLLTAVGGAQRQESVMSGLNFLAQRGAVDDWVLVHDAARPCLTSGDLGNLLDALPAIRAGAGAVRGAVLAAPIVDTVRRERDGRIETVDRQGLWRALTPQAFTVQELRQALGDAAAAGVTVTDEAQALERLGWGAVLVPGSPFNIKVTRAEDLALAAGILEGQETMTRDTMTRDTMTRDTMTPDSRVPGGMPQAGSMRVGQGIDVHAFGPGDHVVLGGVRIPNTQGVIAHSDGDVVIHALCDALLGALGDGDIGQHFPDSDPRYRGADSRVFLRVVAARVKAAGLALVNADITVLAEAPRVAAHRNAMAANLAADLEVSAQFINIKATTTERLGFIGRKEGLAALASVLLSR